MLRQAAEKTGEMVGDGTSTATVLAHAILADGIRNVVAGASAVDIKRGLDLATGGVVEALKAMSRTVSTHKEKLQVATISAHNDQAIGELVAEAIDKIGSDGVVTVEESKTTETVLDVVEGMQFDRGYISPISQRTRKRWRRFLKTRWSFSWTTESRQCPTFWPCSKPLPNRVGPFWSLLKTSRPKRWPLWS